MVRNEASREMTSAPISVLTGSPLKLPSLARVCHLTLARLPVRLEGTLAGACQTASTTAASSLDSGCSFNLRHQQLEVLRTIPMMLTGGQCQPQAMHWLPSWLAGPARGPGGSQLLYKDYRSLN
jgi:hypothetical protein